MPNSEMMKSTHRYGWKLVCGWLPPADPTLFGASVTSGLSVPYGVMVAACVCASTWPAGLVLDAGLDEASKACGCPGICCVVSVTSSTPAAWDEPVGNGWESFRADRAAQRSIRHRLHRSS